MSGMAFRPRKEAKRVTLSVTPLIDVLFLLIIFFTLTSTFKREGELDLELPESSTATTAAGRSGDRQPALELVITESGEITLDGDRLEMAQLEERLPLARETDPSRGVTVKAEAAVPHGDVVHVLDLVRDAGFPGVGIGTHLTAMGPVGEPSTREKTPAPAPR